jgi:teichuronic acid biosynthesis glycosyltransferase TuaG
MRVSVLMPAYNAEKYIAQSIESVLNQTYRNIELIIVNDGSRDNTESVVKEFMQRDSRIKYLKQENGRQGKARNTAFGLATGEFIALLDSDDLWDADKTEKQIQKMEAEKVDFVYSNARILYEGDPADSYGKPIDDLSGGMSVGRYEGKEMFNLLIESNRIITQTALFKRKCIEQAGGFEEELKYQNCEDYDLWLRMAYLNFSFYGIHEIQATYRRHASSATGTVIAQLKPEMNVIHRLFEKGMISASQRSKTISWLIRVLSFSLHKAGRVKELKDLFEGKIIDLPKPAFFYRLYLLKDLTVYRIKRPIKKLIGK